MLLYLFAHYAEIVTLRSLSMIPFVAGVVIYLFGFAVLKELVFPISLLLFLIPIPSQIYSQLTIPLQLFVSMVCFPGQGWQVSKIKSSSRQFNGSGPYNISFSSMVARRGEQKELIVYWFQSYDKTNANTFSQKISSFFQRVHGYEGNAFVRISTSLNGKTEQQALEAIKNFVRAFYPVFLKYVKETFA